MPKACQVLGRSNPCVTAPNLANTLWFFVIFGEHHGMAQLIAKRVLIAPLIHKDFPVRHSLLARSNVASVNLNHQKRHVDWLYTPPPDENGRIKPTILPVAGRPATRMGRGSACRFGRLGPIFLQAAEGQGVFARPDWYSGFLFSWEVTKSQEMLARFARASCEWRVRYPPPRQVALCLS
jgi:hypothetical protein